MIRKLLNYAYLHWRLGIGAWATTLAIPLLAVHGLDLIRFGIPWQKSPVLTLSCAPGAIAAKPFEYSRLILLVVVVLPILAALFRQALELFLGASHKARPSRTIAGVFLSVALLAVAGKTLCLGAERLSGRIHTAGGADTGRTAFKSWSGTLEEYYSYGAVSVAGLVFSSLVVWALRERFKASQSSSAPDPLRAYFTLLQLSGSSSRHNPIGRSQYRNFNFASTGNPSARVVTEGERTVRKYLRARPGSLGAEDVARDRLSSVTTKISRMLQLNRAHTYVHLFTGTGRALEAAIASVPGAKALVVSPYEHPTELAVARWIEKIGLCELRTVTWRGADLEEDWATQQVRLVKELSSNVRAASAEKLVPVVLLSEVCWCTGQRLPVQDLWKEIRAASGIECELVVDGAHSVGNTSGGWATDIGSCYVFSAHKWIGSSEPGGVLIRNGKLDAYDASSSTTLAASVVPVRMLASLEAAVDHWLELDRSLLDRTSRSLRELLEASLPPSVRIVESRGLEKTNLLAVAPRSGFRWRASASGLRRLFEKWDVVVGVAEERGAGGGFWLRIAVAPMTSYAEIRSLRNALRRATQPDV